MKLRKKSKKKHKILNVSFYEILSIISLWITMEDQ